ncbi:hypothetical protein BJX63DRAFT_438311 [Aspergillus granulosus]|uniref:Uncharacterized protein n=1 Tax=Aspergillus granulosus TaxID=176169 RepID=A0ABR4GSD4_9EURO
MTGVDVVTVADDAWFATTSDLQVGDNSKHNPTQCRVTGAYPTTPVSQGLLQLIISCKPLSLLLSNCRIHEIPVAMITPQFLLLTGGITASASVLPFLDQTPLAISNPNSGFLCDLPPILDPASDGLPSAESLFTSHEALETQVKRHRALVQVPSIY